MADKFVPVRLIEDHSVTRELAEKSLPFWAHLWEPIPDEELPAPSPSHAELRAGSAESPAAALPADEQAGGEQPQADSASVTETAAVEKSGESPANTTESAPARQRRTRQ